MGDETGDARLRGLAGRPATTEGAGPLLQSPLASPGVAPEGGDGYPATGRAARGGPRDPYPVPGRRVDRPRRRPPLRRVRRALRRRRGLPAGLRERVLQAV